ncbi:transmembrane protein 132C-like [Scleropages formosus]|uniref:transmembrane protein 132C-like n=1 Tax=Scleropages formosus TaxID=113540 RepID=UPI0010FACA91|nr:transmembrane protein 132C-like [Scleropages formosus]
MYLPVEYQVINADLAFFLREANQDIMRNSSLQVRTECFFVQQARRAPSLSATYGPLSIEQPIPLELLQPPGTSSAFSSSSFSSSTFPLNWKVQAVIVNDRVVASWPKVQVLFHVTGRDWDDYAAADRLPCVTAFAFHETEEVRATCRLRGALALCVAQLEPLASWFEPPSVVPGRQKAPGQAEGTPVELYYMVWATESDECGWEDSRKGGAVRPDLEGMPRGIHGSAPLLRIGSLRLYQSVAALPLDEVRLDLNFAVLVPPIPVQRKGTVSIIVAASGAALVDMFTLRVRLTEGVAFLGARPSDPVLWTASQEARNEGHREVTLHCQRKVPRAGQRQKSGLQKVLQVDLELDGLLEPLGSRSVMWQVEYPGTRDSEEVETRIHLAHEELEGIVPLAMDAEILNTAALTGKTVAVPVKVVAVGNDGALQDITESVDCQSTDEDVVKVSERCDYVYVNGKETRGRVRMQVNFTYSYLSAQLHVSVWMPQLPLQIQVSDTELSQIKGWRVPVAVGNQRSARDSEDEDDDEQRGRACSLQYQHATVRVLTRFMAEPSSRRGALDFLLGSDWQVDVSELVRDLLKVADPRVAWLRDGRVLVGLETGVTSVQVLSPLSESFLAEKTVRVLEDRVSIVDMGVQVVSALSLSLQLSPGSNRAIVATAATPEVLSTPKQESLISAWLQFSDGSMTPLDLYDPDHFVLSAVSLDESVVTVSQGSSWKWPMVVTEGDGQGLLVRVEMAVCPPCQRSRRRSVLATGSGSVRVKLGLSKGGMTGEEPMNRRRHPSIVDHAGSKEPYHGISVSDQDSGIVGNATATIGTGAAQRPGGPKHQGVDLADFPEQADLPVSVEDDLVQGTRGLTDLEIGMYALLGVFCLAILVFLINCVSYALKYSHKQLPVEGGEHMNHAHDWVWLGNGAELLESHTHLSLQRGEEGGRLLNDNSAQKTVPGQASRATEMGCGGRDLKNEPLNSPTSKRKRVKFTTFSSAPADRSLPCVSPLLTESNEEIKWVCQDMQLSDVTELRNYMERLNENALKGAA